MNTKQLLLATGLVIALSAPAFANTHAADTAKDAAHVEKAADAKKEDGAAVEAPKADAAAVEPAKEEKKEEAKKEEEKKH